MKTTAIITHGGQDRGYKLCRCSVCGVERECVPSFDFYTREDPRGPLVCERCLLSDAGISKPLIYAAGNPNS